MTPEHQPTKDRMEFLTNLFTDTHAAKHSEKLNTLLQHPLLLGNASEYDVLTLIEQVMSKFSPYAYWDYLNSRISIQSYPSKYKSPFAKSNLLGKLTVHANGYWKTIEVVECTGVFATAEAQVELQSVLKLLDTYYSKKMQPYRESEFYKRMEQAYERADYLEARRYARDLQGGKTLAGHKQNFMEQVLLDTQSLPESL